MEPTPGRLTATLVAGKIPVTEEALTMLRAGLSTIGHGYRIEKAISETARTGTELKNDLSRLHVGCRTVVDVLDTDLTGSGQIEAIFYDPWRGSQFPRLVEELRSLASRIETALVMVTQSGAIKKRPARSGDLVLCGDARSFQRAHRRPRTWNCWAVASVHKELRSAD